MINYSESAMIALLPTDSEWCKILLPHMTLVYAGELKDLKPPDQNEMAKDAATIAAMSRPITLRVLGTDVFGDEDPVDVLSFIPTPEVQAMRRVVERWNKSEHPFRPHATIGPAGTALSVPIPTYVRFDRVIMSWGNDHMSFNLR